MFIKGVSQIIPKENENVLLMTEMIYGILQDRYKKFEDVPNTKKNTAVLRYLFNSIYNIWTKDESMISYETLKIARMIGIYEIYENRIIKSNNLYDTSLLFAKRFMIYVICPICNCRNEVMFFENKFNCKKCTSILTMSSNDAYY